MAKMELISCGVGGNSCGGSRKEKSSHVDRQEISAVATSNSNGSEQTAARNAHLQ